MQWLPSFFACTVLGTCQYQGQVKSQVKSQVGIAPPT